MLPGCATPMVETRDRRGLPEAVALVDLLADLLVDFRADFSAETFDDGDGERLSTGNRVSQLRPFRSLLRCFQEGDIPDGHAHHDRAPGIDEKAEGGVSVKLR